MQFGSSVDKSSATFARLAANAAALFGSISLVCDKCETFQRGPHLPTRMHRPSRPDIRPSNTTRCDKPDGDDSKSPFEKFQNADPEVESQVLKKHGANAFAKFVLVCPGLIRCCRVFPQATRIRCYDAASGPARGLRTTSSQLWPIRGQVWLPHHNLLPGQPR